MNLEKVIKENKKVLVDFWAPWCGPCKAVKPVIEELKKEIKDVVIIECNIDENISVAPKYGIKGVPTFIYFENGDISDMSVGMMSRKELLEFIRKV